jgi:[ribosomal protein S5]-alanine N-acetyltransferase
MIETKRLLLVPLTYDQLILYIRADNSLEKELSLNESTRTIPPDLKEALEGTILPHVADPQKNYLYSTLWTLISKAENKMVGDLCFFGEPNQEGEIEIGYGTYDEFQNKGYMTEAVGGMIEWAKAQPNVRVIIADSTKNNKASLRVLEKNNFKEFEKSDVFSNWRFKII